MRREKRFDWFMILLVVPLALLGAFVLYVGSKDLEERKMERHLEYNVDSLRQAHKQLITLEDSLHEFEDGY